MKTLVIALSLAASLAASPSFAQAVSGFGGFKPLPEAGEQPDPSRIYRVIFDVSQGGADDRPLKGLDRVARLVNMLAAGGGTPTTVRSWSSCTAPPPLQFSPTPPGPRAARATPTPTAP